MSWLVVHDDIYPIWADGSVEPSQDRFVEFEDGQLAYKARPVKYWVDIKVEAHPASRPFWRLWRRWLCEVSARRSAWPPHENPGASEQIWTHYYTQDFYASSLRSAYLKAERVADRLHDQMVQSPDLRPDPDPGLAGVVESVGQVRLSDVGGLDGSADVSGSPSPNLDA